MKSAYYIIVVALSTVIAANSLLQVHFMNQMRARQVASLKLAREGNAMAREGMKSISVLYEVDKITGEIERLAMESEKISSGVSLQELKTLRMGNPDEAKKVRDAIVHGNSQGSLAVFIRSFEQGKKTLEYGKISLNNAEIILNTMRWANTQWSPIIKNTETMNAMTKDLIKIMQDSKTLSLTMIENTKKGNQKLQRFIKYFRRIKKEKEKEAQNQNTQETPVTAPETP